MTIYQVTDLILAMTASSDAAPPAPVSDNDAPRADGVLQLLVVIANESDPDDPKAFTSITLSVGGLIVSGELISHTRFWRDLSHEPALASFSAQILKSREETASSEFEWPQFIHLRNAKVWNSPTAPYPSEGTHWRGRISSVDGFWFGTLGSQQRS